MIIRPVSSTERESYDDVVTHPLQSYAWGEFRKKTGVAVERIGIFDGQKLVDAFQVTFHPVPHTQYTVGYAPKAKMPDEAMLRALKDIGRRQNALFIKLEPNVSAPVDKASAHAVIAEFLLKNGCVLGKPLFTRYTFMLDLTPPEDILLANMRPKTRYNLRLAEKKGVTIVENTSKEGMDTYLKLLEETTTRQQFYAHDKKYFEQLWETLGGSGMMHIFTAMFEGKPLACWIVFVFDHKLYYPYGASSREHKEVMASNLMMWHVIQFGKSQGCTSFDMWGALGPDASEKDPWFGFHKFKEGYGAVLTQFVGTYDLVLIPLQYKIFRFVDTLRWTVLKLKSKLHK